jgi:allophanate hydrolase
MNPHEGIPGAAALRTLYSQGKTTVPKIAERAWILSGLEAHKEAWIYRVPKEELMAGARRLQTLIEANAGALAGARAPGYGNPKLDLRADPLAGFPLLGVPFAVKDNIDVAGVPTTAASPGYARVPETSAPAVQKLLDAGALFVGKTNMDQFATGLVGTRSPYGACKNPFDPAYITGGSSSGSALAVSAGMVSFALGTDTAGSGRVPAAFTNIVGLKPTKGAVSTRGVVPACPSLDCVTVFARHASDAFDILRLLEGFDFEDPWSRRLPSPRAAAPSPRFRFGVPLRGQLDFSGDEAYAALYEQGRGALQALGGVEVPVDITPLLRAAQMLYKGPWLAERAEAVFGTLSEYGNGHPESMLPLLNEILAPARSMQATDAFRGLREMQALRRQAEPLWEAIDLLYLPTTPTIFSHSQIAEEPVARNGILGRFTNFVNLMDLCAVALPAGFRPDGLPFGITLMAPAFSESVLKPVAQAWEAHTGIVPGVSA